MSVTVVESASLTSHDGNMLKHFSVKLGTQI
jgi:hypothetical protein